MKCNPLNLTLYNYITMRSYKETIYKVCVINIKLQFLALKWCIQIVDTTSEREDRGQYTQPSVIDLSIWQFCCCCSFPMPNSPLQIYKKLIILILSVIYVLVLVLLLLLLKELQVYCGSNATCISSYDNTNWLYLALPCHKDKNRLQNTSIPLRCATCSSREEMRMTLRCATSC